MIISIALFALVAPTVVFTMVRRNNRGNQFSRLDNDYDHNDNHPDHAVSSSINRSTSNSLLISRILFLFLASTLVFGFILFYPNHFGVFKTTKTFSGYSDNDDICRAIAYSPQDLVGLYGGSILHQYHRDIDTDSELCSNLFDQGMIHMFGFNIIEARRNLNAAVKVDNECAMCYWAIAHSYGPNLNSDVDEDMAMAGKNAIEIAVEVMITKHARIGKRYPPNSFLSESNKGLINVEKTRFSFDTIETWRYHGQTYFDHIYVKNMFELMNSNPTDVDIVAMFGEAVVNLTPWQYYTSQFSVYDWDYWKPILKTYSNSEVDFIFNQTEEHSIQKRRVRLDLNSTSITVNTDTIPPFQPLNNDIVDDYLSLLSELAPHSRPAYRALNHVLSQPNRQAKYHLLALHLWIHIAESGSKPSRGEKVADLLAAINDVPTQETTEGEYEHSRYD